MQLQASVFHSFAETLENFIKPDPFHTTLLLSTLQSPLSQDQMATALVTEQMNLAKSFYDAIGDITDRGLSTSGYALRACRQPFNEVKCGALHLMSVAALFPWGIHALFGTEGFVGYVSDWQTEFTKEGREWKFILIQNACNNPNVSKLNDEVVGKLKSIVSKGPHYVPPQAAGPEVMD